MGNIFNKTDFHKIVNRIKHISKKSARQWGNMVNAIATQTHRETKAMARVKSLDNNSFAIILE